MRVFVTRSFPGPGIPHLIERLGADAVSVYPENRIIPREDLLESVRGVDGILTMLTERINTEVMDAAGPQLRVLSNFAVGYNNIKMEEANARGIVVCNTPDVLTAATADLAWTLILGTMRRATESEAYLRAGKWKSWSPELLLGREVTGATLGIVGMGRIGQAVAARARGFDMPVLYHSRTPIDSETERSLNARHCSLDELLKQSDVVSLHCPLLDATRGLIGARELGLMKPTAVLVNTARGPVVDESALVKALHARSIWGAGLDVYAREPSVPRGLLDAPNTMLLPHVGSSTVQAREAMGELASRNLACALLGEDIPACVNRNSLNE